MKKVLDYANWFINKGIEEGKPIDQMKVQKLLYFAYGWYLSLTGQELFNQKFEAWMYGPVISNLYDELKDYRASKIDIKQEINPPLNSEIESFFNQIWQLYGGLSGIELSKLTHEKDSPWDKTYNEYYWMGNYINKKDIKDYFKAKLQKNG